MKTYLCFNIDGTINKFKFKSPDTLLNNIPSTILNYIQIEKNKLINSFLEYKYKNYIYYIFYDNNSTQKQNMCKLPFLEINIHSEYFVFKFDNELNMLNFTENQVYKILPIKMNKNIDNLEYSSDDFD